MLEFFAGFLVGSGVIALAAYGKRVGLAVRRMTSSLSAAGKDLKKGL